MSDGVHAPRVWVVQVTDETFNAERILTNDGQTIGITNEDDVHLAHVRERQRQGDTPPYLDDVRLEGFSAPPCYVSPASFAPDYVARLRTLVSPKLFKLLDQPSGSLQAIPTDTVWQGENPPDWSYLWLCYVPRVPAVDVELSDVELVPVEKGGERLQQIRFKDALRLWDDLDPPCGVFQAAEGGYILLATDAVAEAVVRAGCTGIEFVDAETAFDAEGPTTRRGSDGPEPYPELVDVFDPDVPRPWDADLPPVGPPVAWEESPVDWFDWEPADTELEAPTPSPESGRPGEALARFLQEAIYFDETAAADVLAAIEDVRAGRSELWVGELPIWVVVVRPDAVWVRLEDGYPGDGPYPFPLDGMATVIKRWAESIERAPHPLG